MFANQSSSKSNYITTGKATLSFQLINQRADFAFALFSGGLENPTLVAVSNPISFANPKAPVYPRLAHGKAWDEVFFCISFLFSFSCAKAGSDRVKTSHF
ncbi:putative phosphodiesterase I [Helianthus annuus]|nr:putative phosphodiesterase I [Helianthus annuus]